MQKISILKKAILLFQLGFLCFYLCAQTPGETRGVKVTSNAPADTLKGEVYAIIMGISNYPGINPLKFADKDALLFSEFLQSPGGGNSKRENIKLLINDSATMNDFYAGALGWLKTKNLKKGDRLYLYFSGHGVAMNEALYFFLPYDCKPEKDENNYLMTGNINMYNVKYAVIAPYVSRGVEVMLIMDACRSNEIPGGKESPQNFTNKFIVQQEMGEMMLLSTGPGQVSIESASIGNGHGLFTYNLIEGLAGAADKDPTFGDNNGIVSLEEISAYVKNTVKKKAKADFSTDQIPWSCCAEKDLTTITKVDASTYTAWEKNKELQRMSSDQNLFAVNTIRQGEKGVDLTTNDTAQITIYNQFTDALKKENLMGEASAETFYKVMEKGWPGNNLTEDAKYSLASKYLNFCQQKINLFLSGKGIVHILNLEKKAAKEKSDTVNSSFAGVNEDELHKLKTLVNTDYIVAEKMMEKAIDLLQREPEMLAPYLPRFDFLKTMAAYADKSKKLKTVLQQCNNYIASDSLSPAGYLLKGWIYKDMDNDSCNFYFRKAAAIAPKWPYPLNGLGNYYLSENNYDTALYYFNKAIELDSLNSDAYRNRGLAHLILGGYAGKSGMSIIDQNELEMARKDLVLAKNLNPNDCYAKVYFADHQLAFLRSYQKGSVSYNAYYNNAKTNYLRSIETDSNFSLGYQKLADFYEFLGDTMTGLKYVQECVTKNPKNADGYRNLGNYYLQTLKDTAAAIENFQKAIDLDPGSGSNYFSLARLYRKQKNRAKAIKVYTAALDHIGNNKDLFNEMGNTYFEAPSQFELAIMYYQKALGIDSTLSYTFFNLGKLYNLKDNGKDSSFYYYGKACIYNPYRFRDMIHPVADYYFYDKRYTAARPFYQLALHYASNTKYRDLERLINIQIGEKNFTDAESTLKQYLNPEIDKELYTRLSMAINQASGKN